MTDRELRDLIYCLERMLDMLERTELRRTDPTIAACVAADINFLADLAARHLYDAEEYRRWTGAP
jgi:hypothetical protein